MNILIHWKPEFDLGIKEIDQHHRKLVDLINVVYHSHICNLTEEVINEVTTEMLEYAFVHFTCEEKYFKKYSYDNTDTHVKEHQYFITKVKRLQFARENEPGQQMQEILTFLKNWLETHIMQSDKKYVSCFIENGAGAL